LGFGLVILLDAEDTEGALAMAGVFIGRRLLAVVAMVVWRWRYARR
jgi:hypothetical protein